MGILDSLAGALNSSAGSTTGTSATSSAVVSEVVAGDAGSALEGLAQRLLHG
jgi:hypothetical protein